MNKKITNLMVMGLAGLGLVQSSLGANPILPSFADPHMRVWGDKMYISVGKDRDPGMDKFYIINWTIFSTTNLVDWTLETVIDPADTHLGDNFEYCWATDITTRNGKYYLYGSEHGDATSVFVADKPNGPYKDVLGKSMIAEDYSVNHEYDPTIFVEDNGDQYIIFGRDGQFGKHLFHYQMAKLSDDMVSFDGKPVDLLTTQKYGFGNAKSARDHQYFHKHDGIYYLSCAGVYMTSTNRTGPFERPRKTGHMGHSSFSSYNGQDYCAYEWTCEPYGNRRYRQIDLTYLHYKDNGDMVVDTAFLQDTSLSERGEYFENGVANYDAQWPKIEAEWFFKIADAAKKECPNGGFEIQQVRNGAYLNFPLVRNLKANSTIAFEVSSVSGATIEVREGSANGALLGRCKVPVTGGFEKYQTVSCTLKNEAGTRDLYFVFTGESADLLHVDSFRFE